MSWKHKLSNSLKGVKFSKKKMVINTHKRVTETLERFKQLSADRNNHKGLLKDKKAILYAATCLEDEDVKVLKLCLDIFENFLNNEENHLKLISTFGIYEALESLSIRIRNTNESIFKRASEITEILRNSAPPAFGTRSRTRVLDRQTVYLLSIPNLTTASKQKFENTLLKIKGVISFLVDVQMKRCTLRICSKITIKQVVVKIFKISGFQCLVVRKNKEEGIESYYDILDNTPNNNSYLEYPEEDFLQRSGAVTTMKSDRKSGPGLFNNLRTFWQESFYW